MGNLLKVLIIEDSESDAVMIADRLTQGGFDVESVRVDSADEFKEQLKLKEWDVIICDYVMPSFSAMDALAIKNERKITVPFIVLTGILSSEIAPELIKAGVTDFVTKSEMPKLVAVVGRETGRIMKENMETLRLEKKRLFLQPHLRGIIPVITIRNRFIAAFVAITAIVFVYGFFIVEKGFSDAGFMAFQKASAVSHTIVPAIGSFLSAEMNSADSGVFLDDTRNRAGYDLALFDRGGKVISVAGKMGKEYLSVISPEEIETTIQDGGPRAINVVSGGIIPGKFLLAGVKNNTGKISGVLALDYTKDYIIFLKYGFFYAATALFVVLAVLAVILISWHFLSLAVLRPVEDIKKAMEKMAEGDLTAAMEIKSYDELGRLAYSFETMRERLRETFDKLKLEIHERYSAEKSLQVLHLKLTNWVSDLDKRTHEIAILNQMGKMLRSCKSMEEFHSFTRRYCEQLFPEDRGAVYLFNETGKFMEAASMWGKKNIEKSFSPEACWGIRDGHIYSVDADENMNRICGHIMEHGLNSDFDHSVCVPMTAMGKIIGMFHLRSEKKDNSAGVNTEKRKFAKEQLVTTVVESITLAYSNIRLQDTLRQQSTHDSLTGLFNRRHMKDSLEREFYIAQRHIKPFAVIMLDIDHFKKYNDDYGHDAGDMVLEKIGLLVKAALRPEDIPCRYGGEEFLIILPGTDREGANHCALRLLEDTRNMKVENANISIRGITISLGVASYPENGDAVNLIVKAADTAMLDAKKTGRNCIVISREAAANSPV